MTPSASSFLEHHQVGPIQKLAFDVLGVCKRGIPRASPNEREPKPELLRKIRADVRLRLDGPSCERGCRGRGPYCGVPGLPARIGEPAASGRSVGLLAHRCAASDDVAAGA